MKVYDGVAVSPNGNIIGLEVKSGNARLTKAQRSFDSRVSRTTPAIGIGKNSGLEITRTIIRR